MLNFDEVDVIINNSGVLAETASISSTSSLGSTYSIGYIRSLKPSSDGPIQSNISLTYLPEISKEPNYAVVNKIKSLLNDHNYYGERIEIAGIHSDNCFITSYSLSAEPNNIVTANCAYTTYWPLCGSLKSKNNQTDYHHYGDILHGWSSYVLSSGEAITRPIYNLNYEFNANWYPVYKITSKYPIAVKLLNIEETISFSIDEYREINYTGENVYGNLFNTNNGNIQFKNLSLLCENNCEEDGGTENSLLLNISGFLITEINPVVEVNNVVRVNYKCKRYK